MTSKQNYGCTIDSDQMKVAVTSHDAVWFTMESESTPGIMVRLDADAVARLCHQLLDNARIKAEFDKPAPLTEWPEPGTGICVRSDTTRRVYTVVGPHPHHAGKCVVVASTGRPVTALLPANYMLA